MKNILFLIPTIVLTVSINAAQVAHAKPIYCESTDGEDIIIVRSSHTAAVALFRGINGGYVTSSGRESNLTCSRQTDSEGNGYFLKCLNPEKLVYSKSVYLLFNNKIDSSDGINGKYYDGFFKTQELICGEMI